MALWSANRDRVPAPEKLTVDQTIVVPPPEALDRSLVVPPTNASGKSAASKGADRSQPGLLTSTPRTKSSSEIPLALPTGSPTATKRATPPPADQSEDYSVSNAEPTYPRYRVGTHDTLRSIARDTLGDSRRSDEILELNRDQIDDPRQLTPGIMLVLPDDARIGRRKL
jgi:nucleoid-associated protein YgaU